MSRIEVKIGRLVLNGLAPQAAQPLDRRAIVNELRNELSRILSDPATRAAWARSRRTAVLRLGRISLQSGPSAARKLGGSIARAIGKGLKS